MIIGPADHYVCRIFIFISKDVARGVPVQHDLLYGFVEMKLHAQFFCQLYMPLTTLYIPPCGYQVPPMMSA